MELTSSALYFYPLIVPLLAKSKNFFFFARTSLYFSLSDVSLYIMSSKILKELSEPMSKTPFFPDALSFSLYTSFSYFTRAFWFGRTGLGFTADCLLLAVLTCSSNLSIDSSMISLNQAPILPS